MSFAKAAQELNVTPAALSFQIKSLEDHLGVPVFHRMNRAVELTEAGRVLAPATADGFATLTAAWRSARRLAGSSSLNVTAGPAFTAKWLAPRMFNFAQEHPEIDLRFSATLRMLDFDRDEVDVAIRFGYGPDKGLFSIPLLQEWATPMVSPELAETLRRPEDLLNMTLIHQDDLSFLNPSMDWKAWFALNNLGPVPEHGPHFSQADHALDAAQSGAGVILGRFTLASKALREGRLVMPFDLSITTEANYRFVCPKGGESRPHIKAFLDWVTREVGFTESLVEGRRFVAAADVPPAA